MDRREALRRVAWMMGGAISASTVAGVLGGCRAGEGVYRPQALTPAQHEYLATVVETILPTTDTPGAQEARVHDFIDVMLTEYYRPAERAHFLDGLAAFEARAEADYGAGFATLTQEQRLDLLTTLHEEAQDYLVANPPTSRGERYPDLTERPFMTLLKELTLIGYYTSEIGATQELADMPFGRYDGNVPYAEIGRAWS